MIVVAGAVEEAFKVSLKDRVQERLVEQNSSTFQFLRVVVDGSFEKAFQVSRKDRVQQRAVQQITLTLQFLRVVAGERGLLGFRPDPNSPASSSRSYAVDEPFQGFFSHFSLADIIPWTPAACAESMAFDDDESEAEVEEGAATRFAAGFRTLRVCTWFLEHQMGRPVWGCPFGDRCTFAHSWVELHPEASAHEQQLASYFPD